MKLFILCLTVALLTACGDSSNKETTTLNNLPPTISAGINQTVLANSIVLLQGSGNDPDGTIVSFQWEEVKGTNANIQNIVLTTPTQANSQFQAPNTTENLTLTFQLTITDNNNNSVQDTVAITVAPINNQTPTNVKESLNRLGINADESPRIDGDQNVIDDTYAPMGKTISIMKIVDEDGNESLSQGVQSELFLAGLTTINCEQPNCNALLIDDSVASIDYKNAPPILSRYLTDSPWINEALTTTDLPLTLRSAIGADVDGDGIDEVVVVYFNPNLNQVHITVTHNDEDNAPIKDIHLALNVTNSSVRNLTISKGNFDSDFKDELAIGIGSFSGSTDIRDSQSNIFIIDDEVNNFNVIKNIPINAINSTRAMMLILQSAQLDYDGAMELVVIQNEMSNKGINVFDPDTGANNRFVDADSKYYIFDNVISSANLLKSGAIEADYNLSNNSNTPKVKTKHSVISNVVVGDTDNDTLDEIYFSGLTDVPFSARCISDPDTGLGEGHILLSFEDAIEKLEPITSSFSHVSYTNCPDFAGRKLRYTHLNLLDIDGDKDLELQLNQFIFDKIPNGYVDWYSLDEFNFGNANSIIFKSDASGLFDQTNSMITTADVTGDGKQDIISFLNNEDTDEYLIKVHGIMVADTSVSLLKTIKVTPSTPGQRINPILLAVNADFDTTIYGIKSYQYALTEPIVLGVLAAPPCKEGVNQNIDACTTTWGQSSTIGVDREKGFKLTRSKTVGYGAEFQTCGGVVVSACTTVAEFSIKAMLEVALDRTRSEGYELTSSIAYTTGAIEDSVIFTVVPVDTYTYQLISRSDNTEVGGVNLVVTLPRNSITTMTTLDFYNANVSEPDDRIPDHVFVHTPGDPSSYLTASTKIDLLTTKRSQLDKVRIERFNAFNPVFDDKAPLDAVEGLEVGPISVGEGSGSVELGLDLAKHDSLEISHEINFSIEMEMSAGPAIVGVSMGVSGHRMLTVSKGESTSYIGNIGSIKGSDYEANNYQVGLMTYLDVNRKTGAEFEVINYWVE